MLTSVYFRDDLLRAIKKLKALGNGFTVIPVGGTYMIQSVPGELSLDHTAVIQAAQVCLVCQNEFTTR
jgi:ESCRT-II complex subunit VPS22